MTTPLSPAAQAVWDAFNDAYEAQGLLEDMGQPIAAALRAAADQVVPNRGPLDRAAWSPFAGQIRSELLAIATELENA